MADRTVSVKLKADVDAYNRGVIEAKTATEGLQRSVVVLERDVKELTPETVKASKATEMLSVEAGKAKTQTKGLGEELGKTKTQTTGLGEESGKTREKIVDLADDITKAKTALAELGVEFRRTGSIDIDAFNKASASLRQLERAKADLAKLIPGDGQQKKGGLLDFALDEWIVKAGKAGMGAGAEAGKLFSSGLQGALSTREIGPLIGAAIVGGIIVATPVITSALAAAVNLGIGGGVLALGISRAVADTRVTQAWSHLADAATTSLDNASASFVDPLVHSAHTVESAWADDVMPHIGSAMDALAPQIDGLTQGVVGFLHELGPGFDDAVSAARPFIDILSERLPEIGAAISSFLSHLNNAGPGAEMFFEDLLTLTEGAIRTLGWLVEKGSAVYEVFAGLGEVLHGNFKSGLDIAKGGLDHLFSAAEHGEKSFGGFHNRTIDVNTALGLLDGTVSKATASGGLMKDRFADVDKIFAQVGASAEDLGRAKITDKLMGSLLGMGHATLGVAESLTSLRGAFDQNGLAIDGYTGLVAMNTAKGQANREAVLSAVESNLRMYDAQIASGASAETAAAAYGQNTEALRAQLRQAGLTEVQIGDLIDQYGNVPAKVNTEIAMKGLTDAIGSLDDAIRLANHLDGRHVDTYVTTHYRTDGTPIAGVGRAQADFAMGGIRHAAVGMVIPASDPGTVLTGEPQTGGEVLIPMRGIDTSRAAMLGKAALGNYGLDVVPRPAPGYAAFAGARPMAYGGTGNTTNVNVTVNAGMGTNGYQVGQQIVDHLRSFVAGNGNNVQMAIVGRQVP